MAASDFRRFRIPLIGRYGKLCRVPREQRGMYEILRHANQNGRASRTAFQGVSHNNTLGGRFPWKFVIKMGVLLLVIPNNYINNYTMGLASHSL